MSDPDPRGGVAASEDPACAVAHGHAEASADGIAHGYAEAPVTERTLVAVFASPVARFLLAYARDAGFRPVLVEPAADHTLPGDEDVTEARALDGLADRDTDVVVTDHHRPELGAVLRDALASPARWVGVMGPCPLPRCYRVRPGHRRLFCRRWANTTYGSEAGPGGGWPWCCGVASSGA